MVLSIADFLFPRELSVSTTKLSKVLVIGACFAEEFVRRIRDQQVGTDFEFSMTNNGAPLPPISPEDAGSYDCVYVVMPLSDLLAEWLVDFRSFGRNRQKALESAKAKLVQFFYALTSYNRDHSMLTFVTNFLVPQASVTTAIIDKWGPDDFCSIVRELNRDLAELVIANKNMYLADLDSIANSLGKKSIMDDMLQYYAHAGFFSEDFYGLDVLQLFNAPVGGRIEPLPDLKSMYDLKVNEYFFAVWRQAEAMYRIVNQVDLVKLVVFDLDDTLWRGQIAENYGDEGNWPVFVGWPIGVWEAIQHLRARGILVAVCSKNDEALVRARWSRAMAIPWVGLEDFAFVEIGWGPKAEAIARMLRQANLTPKSVVFVDDNPVERAAVAAALPGIRVIGGDPYATRRILLWSSETQIPRISDETSRREQMIAAQTQREAARTAMSREDFLSRLNCKVGIIRLETDADEHFTRALELINKTNQFNTTGERVTFQELSSFLSSGGKVYVFSVADIYTQYGIVGVVRLSENVFTQVVMSCRVIGLDVETSVLKHVMANQTFTTFEARVVETESNKVCRDLFTRAGFEPDGHGLFRRDSRPDAEVPSHLTILAA